MTPPFAGPKRLVELPTHEIWPYRSIREQPPTYDRTSARRTGTLSLMSTTWGIQRLNPKTTAILVVDVQERLASAMPEGRLADMLRAARILIDGGRLLGARSLFTEQYPKGLGRTLAEVASVLEHAAAPRFEKLHFSAFDDSHLRTTLADTGTEDVVVLGMETHVCVFQSVRDLSAAGYRVHVPVDGVVSRRDDHRQAGLGLCERAGALLTTAESVAFDWLVHAKSPEFKAISALVR